MQKLAALRARHMVTDEARQDDVPPLPRQVAIIAGEKPRPPAKPRPRDRRAVRIEIDPGEIERAAAAFAPARDPREHNARAEAHAENTPGAVANTTRADPVEKPQRGSLSERTRGDTHPVGEYARPKH